MQGFLPNFKYVAIPDVSAKKRRDQKILKVRQHTFFASVWPINHLYKVLKLVIPLGLDNRQ